MALLALALSACATTPTAPKTGLPVASSAMPLGAKVTAPDGFLNLCMRSPTDCALQDSFSERIRVVAAARELSRQRWRAVFAARHPRFGAGLQTAAVGTPQPPLIDMSGARPASLGRDAVALADAPAPMIVAIAATETVTAEPRDPPQEAAQPDAPAAPQDAPSAEPAPPTATPALVLDRAAWSTLARVNREVNRKIHKASDRDAFGVEDWWAAPLSQGLRAAGDCEDYVLEKRRALIARGVPAAALSIALARTSWGEPHAVLVVATDRGDYVLDNLSREVKPWREVDYAWTARQAPEDLLTWVSLEPAAL